MKNFIRAFLISISTSFCLLAQVNLLLAQTASILPQAETQFLDNNGNPVTSGTVDFYIPGSTTRKTTWQDAAMSIANTNPVKLDAAGRSIIYGYGGYREVLKDKNGNLLWDRVTNSYSIPNGQVTTGDGNLVGTIIPWSGLVAPTQYIFAYGQELSRIGFSALYNIITLTQTGNCTIGSNVISGVADTSQVPIGTHIESSCFSGAVTVSSKTSTSYTVSANSIITASNVTILAFPYGNGNGTTTYNVPDLRGRILVGRDNMGGISASRLTSAYFGNGADGIGATGGNQDNSLINSNLPPYTPSGIVSKPSATAVATVSGSPAQGGISSSPINAGVGGTAPLNTGTISVAVDVSQPTFSGTAQGGSSLPFGIVQPSITVNYVIKVIPDQTGLAAAGVLSIQTMAGALICNTSLICANQLLGVSPSGLSAVLDSAFSSTQGSILYRNASTWAALPPGNSGFVLSTGGAAANPLWIANTNPSTPQAANTFSAGPVSGANTAPTFRFMTAADLPKGLVVTPEMFGAACGLGSDATTGIQAAIDYLASHTGGTVLMSPCIYKTTAQLNITHQGTSLVGMQSAVGNGTELYFVPSIVNQCAISISNGASEATHMQLRNFAIRSPDTTTYKTAICAQDFSNFTIQNMFIWSWTGGHSSAVTNAIASPGNEIRLTVADAGANWGQDWTVSVKGIVGTTEANSTWPITVVDATHIDLKGSTFTNAYVSGGTIVQMSTGIRTNGREYLRAMNFSIGADVPLRISKNPNYAFISLDQSTFFNTDFNATQVAGNTACVILIDDGAVLSAVKWTGTQAWTGGASGMCWRDRSAPSIQQTVLVENLRNEQVQSTSGWTFDIQPSTQLYSFHINNTEMAVENGIRARNIVNLQIDNSYFIGVFGQVCLDLDNTVQSTSVNGIASIAGSSNNLSGQIQRFASANTVGGCLPPFAQYSNSNSRATYETLWNANVSGGSLSLGQAGGVVGQAIFGNATSGTITVQPTTGALGSSVATLPVGTYDLVGNSLVQTFTNKTLNCSSGNTCTYAVAGATDYAANTWPCVITTDGTVGTPTYSIQVCSYEHIGRQWTTRFHITLSGWSGSPTGDVFIAGLPHANNATTNDWGNCVITAWSTSTPVIQISGLVKESASTFPLFRTTAAATGQASLSVAEFGSTGSLVGYCNYHE